MAEHSTGGSDGGAGSCELCGEAVDDLRTAKVAGAELAVCRPCARHGEVTRSERSERSEHRRSDGSDDGRKRGRRRPTAGNAARLDDGPQSSARWEREGTDYDADPLPYLVRGYADRVVEARRAAGLQLAELADELNVDESALLAVEQGRAARAGVGGSLVAALEERLDVALTEEPAARD